MTVSAGATGNDPPYCDIVMKGGITSGIVYPGAVMALHEHYRFKCLGGSSAGGIAAALAAAAEYGRERGGFDEIERLPTELAATVPGGGTAMLALFQPDEATRPLFRVAFGFLQGASVGLARIPVVFPLFPLLGLTILVASVVVTVLADADWGFALAGAVIALAVSLVGAALQLLRALGRLPQNDYGLCRLGPSGRTGRPPAATEWLHQKIQATAYGSAADAPLTFADLWAGPATRLSELEPAERFERVLEMSRDPASRVVDLQLMTTDLTRGLPLRLPVPYQQHRPKLEENAGALLFDPEEFTRFFPADIVAHLRAHAPAVSEETRRHLERLGRATLLHFPIGPELPVVVATRMSLSFPVLISAIPLYELDFRHPREPPLVRVLFSDGGISSNFPVHFFDAPLPTRPTFALNLTGFEPGERPDPSDPCSAVRPPARFDEPAFQAMTHIDGLPGFLAAIKDATQNWRDNAQAELPGFRDRVVDVRLATGEGGLNLTMNAAKITELAKRGTCAGETLVKLFADDGQPQPAQWNGHRFVRFRTTMSVLERFLRAYRDAYESPADSRTIPYASVIATGTTPPAYRFPGGSSAFAQTATQEYLDLVARWTHEHRTLDDRGVPRPPSTLRAVPPV